jgi:hypothetical protein
MATYTLHLGFNWNSPLIGSFWAEPISRRFLQYALADGGKAPAWFRFAEGDVIAVEIWDLTEGILGTGDMALAPSLAFTPLDEGTTTAYSPDALVSAWGNAEQATYLVNGKAQPYLSLSEVSSIAGTSSPWGPARGHYGAGAFTVTAQLAYKMSFFLRVALAGTSGPPRDYVSDPEVIVGPRGG